MSHQLAGSPKNGETVEPSMSEPGGGTEYMTHDQVIRVYNLD